MTITKFLLARIAEDEAAVVDMECQCDTLRMPDCPDRVLAECEAKRRVVEWTQARATCEKHDPEYDLNGCPGCLFAADCVDYDRVVLTHLAEIYADHPDYDSAWSVSGA